MHANSQFLMVDSGISEKYNLAKIENFQLSHAFFSARVIDQSQGLLFQLLLQNKYGHDNIPLQNKTMVKQFDWLYFKKIKKFCEGQYFIEKKKKKKNCSCL